jgi:hypothetical protein
MWKIGYSERRGEQVSVLSDSGEEVWYVWSGIHAEAPLRAEAKQNAAIAIAIACCDLGKPGTYLVADLPRVRETANLLATQVAAIESAITTGLLAEAAVVSCEMKDTAAALVAFAVAARSATESHVRDALRAEGRFRDKQ